MLGRDVFLITGNGTGKILCYLLCNMVNLPGIMIVFSPLLSLMTDQVESASFWDIKSWAISRETMKANPRLIRDVARGVY